jgi:hypothetical protein
VLATDADGRVAIAYEVVGAGRTVYLGSLHMADSFFFNPDPTAPTPHTPDSPVDQLFERAVAWAGGATAPAITSFETTPIADDYSGTDTLAFVTTPVDATLI